MTSDIPVKYINSTGSTDFQVLVFTKNYSPNTPETYFAAWQVLRAQTEADFVYPVEIEVGATYQQKGQTIISGPFGAALGSTWGVVQATPSDTTVLSEIKGAPANPNNTIVIKNQKPKSWSGQKYDIGVYKSGRLLVVQKEVRVLDQVDFMLQPRLYFAVARNMFVGKIFTSLEISSNFTEFDLSQYPNGIQVTLNQAAGGGEYSFTAQQLM